MKFIPLMSPDIPEQSITDVVEVLRSGMLVQGKNVEALENEIAEYLGIKNAVAVSNGTATLHLALLALGIGPGDEVIVPAFSYIATANVVEVVGAKCVFVDIDGDTFNIDVDAIEQKISPKTRAIIPVHEFGLACDIHRLTELANQHGLYVIEDAACALGATEGGKFVGTVGNAGSFSLHPRKAITSGEGGLLVTNDDGLAAKFRMLRNHGIDPNGQGMDFIAAGLNYRMTDFQAALVRPQLRDLDVRIERKNQLAQIYFENLKDIEQLQLPNVPAGKRHTWQTFHTVLSKEINRDSVIRKLKAAGVGANYGAQCIPATTYYKDKYQLDAVWEFPNAFNANECGLALPCYEKLTAGDVSFVSSCFNDIISKL